MSGPIFSRNTRKQIVRGDIVASFQYVPVMDEHQLPTNEREPGVIIMRAIDVPKANRGDRVPKVIIGLSAAYKYAVDSYVATRALQYALYLGFGDSRFTVHRIADFLNDMLIELCTMKPEREEGARQEAALSVRPDGSFVLDVAEPELH